MSFECMAWAINQTTGSGAAKAVLMSLANSTNAINGMCRPRIKIIAKQAELSESTVKACLKHLVEKGFLEVVPRFHEGLQLSNDYRLLTGDLGRMLGVGIGYRESGSNADPGGQETGGVGQMPTQGGSNADPGGSNAGPRINRKMNQEEETGTPPYPPQAGGGRRAPSAVKAEKDALAQAVQDIYQAYPRKVAPAVAMKAIEKACKLIDPKELLQAVRDYEAATSQWTEEDRQFIPMPASWFNQQRWNDDRKEWLRKVPAAKAATESAIPKWKADRIALAEQEVRKAEQAIRSLTAQGLTRETCGFRFKDADDKLLRARQNLAAERGELVVGEGAETAATRPGA